jgi:hypothetical protein
MRERPAPMLHGAGRFDGPGGVPRVFSSPAPAAAAAVPPRP